MNSNRGDDIFNINKNNFNKLDNNFKGLRQGDDQIFNKKKISDDIVSSSSASSSGSSVSSLSDTSSEAESVSKKKKKNKKN